MFDSLARLADGHARRIGLFAIAFFLLAGALGGSVAEPPRPLRRRRSRRPRASRRGNSCEDAGLRVPGGDRRWSRTRRSPSPRPGARVEALERELRARGDVDSVTGYYDTRSPAFVSRDGDSTYLAVALKPTDDKQWQEAGGDIADAARRPARASSSAARAVAQEQVNKQVEKDLRKAEMLAFPLLFLLSLLFFRSLVAALLPLMIGGLAIVGTFLILRIASEFGSISIFALNLTTGAGAGPGDRLQPLHRLPLPRGDRQGRARAGGDAPRARHRGADRLLLLADGRRGARLAARLPAALPLLDGARRLAGRAVRGADLADRAAGGADPARHPGQLARAALPAAPRRGRRAARRAGLLVPALALRDAPAGPGRDAQRPAPDRPRPALLRDQVQHRRPDGAAEVGQRAAGLRHGQRRVPALPRDADLGRRRRAAAPKATAALAARVAPRRRASPTSPRRSRCGAASTAIQAISANPFNSEREPSRR